MSTHPGPFVVRHLAAAFIISLFVVSCVRPPARFTQEQPRDMLYSGMVGKWRGTRVLADSARHASSVTLTDLVVVPAPDRDGLELRYRHHAGGADQQVLGHWHFGRGLDVALLGDVRDQDARPFRITGQVGGRDGAPLQLVLETDGFERAQPARIRQVIDVSTGTLRIRREVQVAGGDFMFREAYVLRRAE